MVSDKDEKCPNCGEIVDQKIYCVKCGSANVEISVELSDPYEVSLVYLFRGKKAGVRAEKEKIAYTCKDCKKTFYRNN